MRCAAWLVAKAKEHALLLGVSAYSILLVMVILVGIFLIPPILRVLYYLAILLLYVGSGL